MSRVPRAGSGQGDRPTALDGQLCFALHAASRSVTALYRPLLEEVGLTYPQYVVMLVLWERDGVPVKELAAATQLDYGTMTPLLKRLEANGLVRRERRPEDERSVLVVLTGEGRALRERTRHVFPAIEAGMGLEADEFTQLKGLLRKLARNAAAHATDG